jgi:hypothetical protein
MPPSQGGRVGLALGASVLGLLLLETGCRVAACLADRKTLGEALKRPAEIPADGQVGLRHMIRLSADDRLIYELRPRLSVVFLDKPVTTNAAGFRDGDYALSKPAGTVRIVGLGDSVMFGWGVGDGEEYLSLVENRLNRERSDRRWEVINTAVPGYNAVMEVATLRNKALELQPDVVIVGFCGNDMSLPVFIRDKEDYFTLRQSFLARFVSRRLHPPDEDDWDPDGLLEPKRGGATAARGASRDASRVPALYAGMVGPAAFQGAMAELARLSRERRFAVVVLFYPGMPAKMEGMLSGLGFHLLDLGPAVRRFLKQQGTRVYKGSALTITRRDPHPSVQAHELIADCLFGFLGSRDLSQPSGRVAHCP